MPMTGQRRMLFWAAGATAWGLALGFVIFASAVMRDPLPDLKSADAIVVLTGGQTRIAEAARLLEKGRGERLLISGVNQKTGRPTLMKLSGLDESKFSCCVDLGYAALDTIGNAAETRRWAEALRYDRLIVVTASYHMPRSLAELELAMPGIEFIPHPVLPDGLKGTEWWLDPAALRLLGAEYLKFLPAAARLAVARGLSPWQGTVTAASSIPPPKS